MCLINFRWITVLQNQAQIKLWAEWGHPAVCPWILNATSTRGQSWNSIIPCKRTAFKVCVGPTTFTLYKKKKTLLLFKSRLYLQLHNISDLFMSSLLTYLWHKCRGSRERSIFTSEYVSYQMMPGKAINRNDFSEWNGHSGNSRPCLLSALRLKYSVHMHLWISDNVCWAWLRFYGLH